MIKEYTKIELAFAAVAFWLMFAAATFLTVNLFSPGFSHVC